MPHCWKSRVTAQLLYVLPHKTQIRYSTLSCIGSAHQLATYVMMPNNIILLNMLKCSRIQARLRFHNMSHSDSLSVVSSKRLICYWYASGVGGWWVKIFFMKSMVLSLSTGKKLNSYRFFTKQDPLFPDLITFSQNPCIWYWVNLVLPLITSLFGACC